MYKTCEAEFRDGLVELKEQPRDIRRARLLVTFLPDMENDLLPGQTGILEGLANIRALVADIPSSRSLAEELIRERRKEACRE